MTMYVDEDVGLEESQRNQIIGLMDLFNIKCIEKKIDNVYSYEVVFAPILYKNMEYMITMETISSLINYLEFKHILIDQHGFVRFVFTPYNYKIFKEIEDITYRDK